MSNAAGEDLSTKLYSQVTFREPTVGDYPFIFSSWLKSYRFSDLPKSVSKTIYFKEHHKIIEDLLSSSTTILACDVIDPNNIFGYITVAKINEIFTVHYIYVKHTYRRFGLGRLLLNVFEHNTGGKMVYTHETPIAKKLGVKYNFEYNPYLMVVNLPKNLKEE